MHRQFRRTGGGAPEELRVGIALDVKPDSDRGQLLRQRSRQRRLRIPQVEVGVESAGERRRLDQPPRLRRVRSRNGDAGVEAKHGTNWLATRPSPPSAVLNRPARSIA